MKSPVPPFEVPGGRQQRGDLRRAAEQLRGVANGLGAATGALGETMG